MASVCAKCKMLCFIFLIISSITCGLSSSVSDKYLYSTFSSSDNLPEQISLLLEDTTIEHVIQKRLTSDQKPRISDSVPLATPVNSLSPTTVKPNQSLTLELKNVGVNGTGIRKNITSTPKPLDDQRSTPLKTVLTSPTVVPTNATVFNRTVTNSNQTEEGNDDDFAMTSFSDEAVNKTLIEKNITKTEYDAHQFYNSTLTVDANVGRKYWLDMTNRTDVKINELLSQSHRRAATIRLSFDFPFYGHIVRNITIATGGFLYTGEYVHSWLAATQYIAPLMANFDTSLSNDSFIKYVDQGDSFTVQWENVSLQDKPHDGNFTFQTTLYKNGDIVFVYQHIPMVIEKIQDEHHPVKVGLSDAYISDRTIFFVRRKTIYEYHRVNFKREDIRNWTVIYLNALPTCLSNKDCVSCLSKPTSNFLCAWCPGTNRCSNGMDRHRQDWLVRGCDHKKIRNETMCSILDTSDSGVDLANVTAADEASAHYDSVVDHSHRGDEPKLARSTHREDVDKPVRMGVSGIITILFLITLVMGLGIWVLYAYRNPHSASGQILIRYRPSQWSWKRGEARYTAATIHM